MNQAQAKKAVLQTLLDHFGSVDEVVDEAREYAPSPSAVLHRRTHDTKLLTKAAWELLHELERRAK